jgi:superfamily II DNA or RNA helicase
MEAATIPIALPACFSKEIKVDRNRARQLLVAASSGNLRLGDDALAVVTAQGEVPIVAGPGSLDGQGRGLYASREARSEPASLANDGALRWIGDLAPSTPDQVRASLDGGFSFQLSDEAAGISGLRSPQLGAVHAVLGHWTIADAQPGTVVMPTGTGKTETMVALFAAAAIERLIVVVPSDALRGQIADKFESLGVLQEFGVISKDALRPVVGRVRHKFQDPESAREFASACNVIVTTPQALFSSEPATRHALLDECSHLFVDEAHHVEAATWRQIRDEFSTRPVVQFTATPFREDGRQLVGRILYTFPLRQAQEENYFSPINYLSVSEFDQPDHALAEKAIEVLQNDIAAGRDHLLMARCKRIGRARQVQEIYEELAPELAPVLLHSSLSATRRSEAIAAIKARSSRIVVCVDMLGEGFDLPALKVAALHDPHKSLGVTLQFIGRFARVSNADIGEATVVVGRPEGEYDDNLRRLYAENADWNHLIRDLSAAAVGEQEEVSEFEQGFGSLPESVSLRNLVPKMSTIVFKTSCTTWNPQAILDLYEEDELFTLPLGVNEQEHVAWFVVESRTPVGWGDLETIADVAYDLYVLYWDDERQLLYINSSNRDSVHEQMARAVCGAGASRIFGENVYRVMSGIQRLVPVNVGVLDVRNRSRRFSMHVGADVIEGFPVSEAQTKTKTNIFAHGFEDGERVTIGAAVKKGRVWSYRVAPTLKHWVSWCDHVGTKISDEGIDLDEVMRNFIRPKSLDSRPELVAIAAEWSWEILLNTSNETVLSYEGESWPLIDTDLSIADFASNGPLAFRVESPHWDVKYEAVIENGETQYRVAEGQEVSVVTRHGEIPLSSFLLKHGLTFFFEEDATVIPPAIFLKPDRDLPMFADDQLLPLDWSGVDLQKESQGINKDSDSIQARAVAEVAASNDWRVVIDDDGPGEIADVVAIRVDEEELVVRLVHCKYSSDANPGARVGDLYEVCGQAQKSIRWRRNIPLFFRRLIYRERARVQRHGHSGFEVGQGNDLFQLREDARLLRPRFEVVIAQPGLAKASISDPQRELLGATEVYLKETAYASLEVFCSA